MKIIDRHPNTGAKIPEKKYSVRRYDDAAGHREEHWIPLPITDSTKKTIKVFKEDGTEDVAMSHEIDITPSEVSP